MTHENKELLLKDLTARMMYGVFVHIIYKEGEPCYGKLTPRDIQWFIDSKIENIKPYLRPMSSMTEEEKKELNNVLEYQYYSSDSCMCESTDWLNANHFDYRGLIEKGLAIAVTKENNPYK
jgi:hypothetical protein